MNPRGITIPFDAFRLYLNPKIINTFNTGPHNSIISVQEPETAQGAQLTYIIVFLFSH